jgi:hypothetical protein
MLLSSRMAWGRQRQGPKEAPDHAGQRMLREGTGLRAHAASRIWSTPHTPTPLIQMDSIHSAFGALGKLVCANVDRYDLGMVVRKHPLVFVNGPIKQFSGLCYPDYKTFVTWVEESPESWITKNSFKDKLILLKFRRWVWYHLVQMGPSKISTYISMLCA